MCSEWGVVPPPTVHRCKWLAGAPRLSTQLSPVRVRSSSRYSCYGASFLLLFLAGRPGRARGGRGTAARVVGLGSKGTSWRELLLFRVGLYFLLRPRRDFLTIPRGTLRSSEWGPGGGGSLGSAPPSASSPLCCQWWVLLGDRSICPLKPPRVPHLRAIRPGSRRLPGFRPRLGLASPLMPLSPPPPLRPRFPDPLPVSSSGTGGPGELWGEAKALRGGRVGSGSRAEVGLSGGRQGASGCSGGIWRLCSRQAKGLEASERGGGAPQGGAAAPTGQREEGQEAAIGWGGFQGCWSVKISHPAGWHSAEG